MTSVLMSLMTHDVLLSLAVTMQLIVLAYVVYIMYKD